ncbi:cell division cycle protein 27 homolog isoform X1 [Centruroides vittatus]|uniref:cell division cycle protein 27 homolog isoform X1 n=1 Tax=Centruroides vittatus TaxID=120091 RepID=UPI00350F6A3A
MIIQEPVQAAIWHALDHYAYGDAIFLAERLCAEVSSDDSLFLLATCYYRAGKPASAYSILHRKGCRTSQCSFLLARCCMDLKKYGEAELALTGGSIAKTKSIEDIINEYGDAASFALQLFAELCRKTERRGKAIESYRKSLKLNPFLWTSYESLVNLGERLDPTKIFNVTNLENFNTCQGNNPLVNLMNKNMSNTGNSGVSESISTPEINQDTSQITGKVSMISAPSSYSVHSPLALIRSNVEPNNIEVFTPENNVWVPVSNNSVMKSISNKTVSRVCHSMFGGPTSISTLTPSFGVLLLDSSSSTGGNTAVISNNSSTLAYITPSPSPLIDAQSNDPRASAKKSMTRRSQSINTPKFQIFSQSGNNNNTTNFNISQTPSLQSSLPPGSLSNVRRSSRLFSSSNSVKENNKSSNRTGRFISTKTPTKKTKTRSTKNSLTQPKESELNELNKSDVQLEEKIYSNNSATVTQTALNMQKSSAEGLMQLLQELGWACLYLGHFCCRKAIEVLSRLPPHHYYTGWVLTALGRAHFELAEYEQAINIFQEVRRLEPHRVKGIEYYSTALWHMQQEVALSGLAQELTEFDKEAAETWCTAGNCFSLQKEHETAIKFLKRSIQIDPDFVYAYTLLGHEHVLTEEMDRAIHCFRNALKIDIRHYNAWYGVGMIYYKQEKFTLAETHFKRALAINPQSSILMCHIGVVQHALKKMDASLATLNKAIAMDPKNPLCKFHRASVYFSLDRHQDALRELEELKELVPKESLVYFLIGKVHKKLGNTHLALMNFSWAMDLDPKGANNQIKEAIDKQYTNDDEEVVTPHEQVVDDVASVSSGPVDHESSHDSSVVDVEDMQLQTMESDESF